MNRKLVALHALSHARRGFLFANALSANIYFVTAKHLSLALSRALVDAHNRSQETDWEILPQEAGPGEVILSRRNELGLLSNFAPTPFVFHGKRYASLEGFWQMMKYPEGPNDPRAKCPGLEWKYTREQVAQMVSFEANHGARSRAIT
ncbi:MAG TPA: hypothetical protein VHD88_04070 [Pyrinomonadaceae bacterium]|nr:hypothetical protein [Pyrinomonadaceae bacterium]